MSSDTLHASQTIAIQGWELVEQFIQAGGPGGQNVNKLSSAVQLRFDARNSPSLAEPVKARLLKLAGRRASRDGVIVIEARRHRTQERNREDARERLKTLIRQAAEPPPPPRKKTRPSRGSIERRLKEKAERATVKKLRGKVAE